MGDLEDLGDGVGSALGCLLGVFFYIVCPIVVIWAAFKIVLE